MSKYSIRIPKPCHEDWNKMSPEMQGRFCSVCSKTVVDFTGRKPDEVDRIIEEKKGEKICGRFNVTQLAPPVTVTIPAWVRSQRLGITRAFAVALFFVFGTGLFSCTTPKDEEVGKIELTGDMVVVENTIRGEVEATDSLVCVLPPADTASIPEEQLKVGEIYIPEQVYALGGPVFIPEEKITVKGETIAQPDTVPQPVEEKKIMMGKPSFNIEKMILPDTSSVKQEKDIPTIIRPQQTVVKKDIPVNSKVIVELKGDALTAWPNPASGPVAIRYRISRQQAVKIEVCSLEGKCLMKLVDQPALYAGEYHSTFDLSSLPNGIVLLRMTTAEKTETVKIILGK